MPAFAPILGCRAKVLILGSMPSQVSLAQVQYYANPRNSFWWIMSQLFRFEENLTYPQKTKVITNQEVAIWDVLFDCERPGSLDSAIVKSSEVVNDFEGFFAGHPELIRIIFNGAAAEKIFMRHCSTLISNYEGSIDLRRCPSTSPAHASMNAQQKLDAWRHAIEH